MEEEVPQVLPSFMVAAAVLFSSLLAYGTAMHLIVRVMVRVIRRNPGELGFWKSIALMAGVTLITAAAHLTQIALWAAAFLLCGQASTLEAAFYFSAQNFTALSSGDIPLTERWRLLGPLESMEGLLFFGLSTAVLFAIMNHLIANRLHAETGYPGGASGNRGPRSAAGVGSSE